MLEKDNNIVKLDSGLISGSLITEYKTLAGNISGSCHVHSYLAIPYAASPTGDLRWKSPQAVKPWQEVKACVTPGHACPQIGGAGKEWEGMKQNEDCLYVNVWAPATKLAERLPVLVWIHGGSYTGNSASSPFYDCANLAQQGAVVVSINFRVGSLAYLAHPWLSQESGKGISGNYGMLDTIAGLHWVKRNISSFGGDSDSVTIFGHSSGGMAVVSLMVSPLSKGLFHKAIVMSGTGAMSRPLPLAKAEAQGLELVKHLGCKTLAELRAKKPDEIVKAAADLSASKGYLWEPVIDGNYIDDQEFNMITKNKQADIPVIIGNSFFDNPLSEVINNENDYRNFLVRQFKDDAGKVLAMYPVDNVNPQQILYQAKRVRNFSSMVTRGRCYAALIHGDKTKPRAFVYEWSRCPPGWQHYGVKHGTVMSYVFGNRFIHGQWTRENGDPSEDPNYTTWDIKLSYLIQQYWLQFAKTGNPNKKGLPEWPSYKTELPEYLDFGDNVQIKTTDQKAFNLFLDIMKKSYQKTID